MNTEKIGWGSDITPTWIALTKKIPALSASTKAKKLDNKFS